MFKVANPVAGPTTLESVAIILGVVLAIFAIVFLIRWVKKH